MSSPRKLDHGKFKNHEMEIIVKENRRLWGGPNGAKEKNLKAYGDWLSLPAGRVTTRTEERRAERQVCAH